MRGETRDPEKCGSQEQCQVDQHLQWMEGEKKSIIFLTRTFIPSAWETEKSLAKLDFGAAL